jgi:hypothetical protein
MASLLLNVLAWPTVLFAVLLFGFAPGAVLRLVVLAFSRDDPRRRELLAELHAVPRLDRPFWVAEQLEVALCEGLPARCVGWRARRKPRAVQSCTSVSGVFRGRVILESSSEMEYIRLTLEEMGRDVRGRIGKFNLPIPPPQPPEDDPEGTS